MNSTDGVGGSGTADWPDRAAAAVRGALGPAATALLESTWAAREADPDVRVVIYGRQNTGKTSLLRRLLAEDGTRVPAWASVSGGKETFEAAEARSAGLCYVDTPGVQAGDAQHTERAHAALPDADALLLCLDQRLFGDAVTDLLPLVTGTAVHPARPRPYPPGALLPVVGKADMWGKDVDSEEFTAQAERLRGDFARQLADHMDRRLVPGLHVVVADCDNLNSLVAPEDLHRDLYLDLGDRDGVEALRTALGALPARRAELRAATRMRFWCRHAARALDAARTALGAAETARDGARRSRTRFDLLEDRLDAVREAGRTKLRDTVREELLRAADSAASAEAAEERARKRLATAVRGWQARWNGELRRTALQGKTEAVTVREAPGTQAFHAYADDIRAVLATPDPLPSGRSGTADTTAAVVLGLGPLVHVVEHELRRRRHDHAGELLGRPDGAAPSGAGQAQDPAGAQVPAGSDISVQTVSVLSGAGDDTGQGDDTGRFPDSGTPDAWDAADLAVDGPVVDGTPSDGSGVGDSMVLLGEQALFIAVSEIRDRHRRKQAERAERRRAERREAAENATDRIAAKLEEPWLGAVEQVRAGIRAQRPDAAAAALVEEEWAHLDGVVRELELVLRQAPL